MMNTPANQRQRRFPAVCSLLLIAGTLTLFPSALSADDDGARGTADNSMLSAMRDRAVQTVVTVVKDDEQLAATLVDQPVFRYSDPPRRFEDATLWVWTDNSRPVAMQKVEAVADMVTGEPMWQFCLTSLSTEGRIHAEWPGPHEFQSVESGLEFEPVPQVRAPSLSTNGRMRQIRTLSRRFSATLIDKPPGGDVRQELRLLPRPLYTYADPDSELPAGTVIGFAANGTNPDALLVLDIHSNDEGDLQWHFALTRMTTGGLEVRFDDEEVWSVDWVRPRPGYNFDRWIHFKAPRAEPTDSTTEGESADNRDTLSGF